MAAEGCGARLQIPNLHPNFAFGQMPPLDAYVRRKSLFAGQLQGPTLLCVLCSRDCLTAPQSTGDFLPLEDLKCHGSEEILRCSFVCRMSEQLQRARAASLRTRTLLSENQHLLDEKATRELSTHATTLETFLDSQPQAHC